MCMTEHSDVKRSGSTYKVGFFSPLSSFFLTRFFVFLISLLTYLFLAFLFLCVLQIVLKDAEYFRRLFGEDWFKSTEGTGILEGIFPVTLSYNLKGNTMRLAFSAMRFKDLDDVVVWDTRDKKRNAAAALTVEDAPPAPPKKMRAIFCLTSRE